VTRVPPNLLNLLGLPAAVQANLLRISNPHGLVWHSTIAKWFIFR
jgi:hypothetical protein